MMLMTWIFDLHDGTTRTVMTPYGISVDQARTLAGLFATDVLTVR